MNQDTLPVEACEEGAEYYNRFATGQEFWDACERPDWMLWAHARSRCPARWAYVALADIWSADAAARASRAAWAADAAAWAAAWADAADAARAAARAA
jgi:hypothetical protein